MLIVGVMLFCTIDSLKTVSGRRREEIAGSLSPYLKVIVFKMLCRDDSSSAVENETMNVRA